MQLCEAIGSWHGSTELNDTFQQILLDCKSSIPPNQWAQFYSTVPYHLSRQLTERYGL